jgi:hypothetical protein
MDASSEEPWRLEWIQSTLFIPALHRRLVVQLQQTGAVEVKTVGDFTF